MTDHGVTMDLGKACATEDELEAEQQRAVQQGKFLEKEMAKQVCA